MISYNKRLFIKTITRQTKILSITLFILCCISFFIIPIRLTNTVQNLLLLVVLFGAVSLLNSKMPSVKLRVYEYKLKFFSNRQLKILLALKVTYYSLVILIIVSNAQFFTGIEQALFEWFYLIICIKSIVIREVNTFEKLKIICFSFLVTLPIVSFYILWLGVVTLFIYTRRIDPDYESMEKMTYFLDNAFSPEFNDQELLSTTYVNNKANIEGVNDYIRLKLDKLVLKIIYLSMLVVAINVIFKAWEVQEYLSITLYCVIYVFSHQVFKQWISDEMRVKKSKLYSQKIINDLILKQSLTFLTLMMIISVLIAISLGDMLFITISLLTLIYIILIECYLELTLVYNMLVNTIFFGIITLLYYL